MLSLLSCAVTLTGCSGAVVNQAPPPEPRPAAEVIPAPVEDEGAPDTPSEEVKAQARALWEASLIARADGDEVTARRVLIRLVRDAPHTDQSIEARVRLAEDALSREDWPVARGWVEPLVETGAAGYQRFRVLALAYEGQTSYVEAAEAWLAASEQAVDDDARRQAVVGAAQDLYLTGKLTEARRVAGTVDADAQTLRERVALRLDDETLEGLSGTVPDDDPDHTWLALLHARARCAAGALKPCKASAEVASRSPDTAIAEEAGRLLQRVAAWDEVHVTKLGVLLPLSGPFQKHGQAALESIQQALSDVNNVDLVVRDTAGKAGQAAQSAQELVLDEHVLAILGPIGEIEGRAAVVSAARFGVPHVVLSSNPSVSEGVSTALRVRLSAEEKVKALARYAVTELGVQKAAVLVPKQEARKRQMAAFWDEFTRLGGEIRAVEFYEPKQRNFESTIGTLLGNSEPGEGTVDFDALFIPDDALQVRRVVPTLKYFGMRMKTHPKLKTSKRSPAVQLLGVEAWNSAAVIDGEGLTDNAVFVDTFFHDPDDRPVDRFVRAFFARHRRKPNAFRAEVYDIVRLLVAAMQGQEGMDHSTREALMRALLATKHHRGVTGHITLLDDGSAVLQPRLLTVHMDDIRLRVSEEEEAYLRRRSGGRR